MKLPYLKTLCARHWKPCLAAWLALALMACSATRPATQEAPEQYAVSIAPVRAILAPIVGDVPIHVITPPGASPHTHEPKPSDAAVVAGANALLYVDPALDGWVTELQARESVALFPLVPESLRHTYTVAEVHTEADGDSHVHEAGTVDPHFWSDPLVVAEIVLPLAERLAALRPARAEAYREGANKFREELLALDGTLTTVLAPARGKQVAVFHHAIDYMLHRYGIGVAGAVEPSPGQTSGPRTLHALAEHLKEQGVKAVFIEPQLSPQAAYAVAEEAGAQLVEIDPNGGVPGRETYAELLLWNAQAIRKAFE
jgi:ABC-type Zn uptake system ZnuABC Zn-binding protein ZnuA